MSQEFEYWYSKGYKRFYFTDSLLLLNKKRIIDFCKYIIEYAYKDVNFTADGVRADHLTFEILQYMKNAHFKSLTIGVESINDETLRFFEKNETFSQIDSAISMADSLGFDITLYFIVGAPTDAYSDVIKSIKYPLKYKHIVSAVVSKLTPIRGTSYYNYAIDNDLVVNKSVFYPKHETYGHNERIDNNNSVEVIWNAVYPSIEKMSEFLITRSQINRLFNAIGFHNLKVAQLNLLTYFALNPIVELLVISPMRIVKSLLSLKK